ncbi:MAG TPA: hypothetical protein VGO11_05795 [Chthoniobacteraceae bacterium]|jgi:hypothetical protein|nr:hypothetical protein [Chthoniobacteraceae bacterium]
MKILLLSSLFASLFALDQVLLADDTQLVIRTIVDLSDRVKRDGKAVDLQSVGVTSQRDELLVSKSYLDGAGASRSSLYRIPLARLTIESVKPDQMTDPLNSSKTYTIRLIGVGARRQDRASGENGKVEWQAADWVDLSYDRRMDATIARNWLLELATRAQPLQTSPEVERLKWELFERFLKGAAEGLGRRVTQ